MTWACRPNHRRSPIATHNAGSSLWMNRQPARASRSSENQTSSAGAPSGAARIGAEDPFELGALLVAQVGAEVEHRLERRVALEVGVAAVEVHESARGEPALLEEHEPDAPAPALDPLLALAALRLATRCPLGAVDARQAALRRARARDALQARGIGDVRGTFREPLQDGLGPLVRPRTADGTTVSCRHRRTDSGAARRSAAHHARSRARSHDTWRVRSAPARRRWTCARA